MAPLAAGSRSWSGRKPSSGSARGRIMAARLDILVWGPWATNQNQSVIRRKQTLLSAQPSASPPAPTGGSNESTTQPTATTKKSAGSRRNKWRRWSPDRRAGTPESQGAPTRGWSPRCIDHQCRFGPMEPKPSQRHTDKEVGAALGISAGTYKRLKRIDNATRSDDKEIRLFAEKQMAPLAAGSPSWNGRKPSSGNRKAATMAARLDILAWGPWAPSQNRSVVRRKQTLLSAQPSASPPAPTGGSNESTTQPAASWRRGRPGTPKQRPPTPGPILPTR